MIGRDAASGGRAHLRCARCGTEWQPPGDERRPRCPECGSEETGAVSFRFSLKVLAILGGIVLLMIIIAAGTAARWRRNAGGTRKTWAERESPASEELVPLPPAKAGRIPCGVCNGDGRIDQEDRDRTNPPFTDAPLGPCPACGGKGGLNP